MWTVHEVSKLTGVSIRTLQYYDKIGLLHPAEYSESGYRLEYLGRTNKKNQPVRDLVINEDESAVVKDFEETQRQINALEEGAMKALTGENKLDLGIVNNMIMKQKARLDAAAKAMEESKSKLDAEKNQKRSNEIQVDEMLTWASRFEDASYEAKHMVIAQPVDRIEVKKDYDITIYWRMTAEQFLGKKNEASA